MQIKAIYEDGIIRPKVPLKLKKRRVDVTVIIPDDSLGEYKAVEPESLGDRISRILGKYSKSRPASTPAQDKTVWHEHLERKYNSK